MKLTHLFLLTLCSLALPLTSTAQTQLLDKIAVVVNSSVITELQVQKEINRLVSSQNQAGQLSPAAIRTGVINKLIEDELQIQEAKKRKIKVDNIALNREIDNIAKQRGLSTFEFYDAVTKQGVSYFEFRKQVRQQMINKRLISGVIRSRVKINPQEITDYLNSELNKDLNEAEFNIFHIVLSDENKAKAIYKDLVNGKDFVETAKANSESESSLRGGDLGWLSRQTLPSSFLNRLLEMNIGDISKPFKTDSGYNIIKINEARGLDIVNIDEVNVRHVLVSPNEILNDEQAFEQISSLRQQLVNGADFANLAKTESDDKGSAANGGSLKWSPSSNYVPEFKAVVDDLPVNTLSQAVKTQFGWHLIEVLDRRTVDKTLENLRKKAEFALLNRKAAEQGELWVNQLRTRAYIDIRDASASASANTSQNK